MNGHDPLAAVLEDVLRKCRADGTGIASTADYLAAAVREQIDELRAEIERVTQLKHGLAVEYVQAVHELALMRNLAGLVNPEGLARHDKEDR